jgi:hypothetical protein
VPLGTELCGVPVDVPGEPGAELVDPVLPELPDEPLCPSASEAGISRTAITSASIFGRMIILPSIDNAPYCHPFRAAHRFR